LEIAKFLLKQEPYPQHQDSQIISVASYYGHFQMIQMLVQHGADVNAQDRDYGSALQVASSKGHISIVELLIEHG
ncbi:ankyrin repeat-containing domain protein, partial [Mycena olivaceomarginata]